MKKLFFAVFSLFICAGILPAQVTVVKVTNERVYLDTSSLGKSLQKGDTFKVIVSSEKLTNPKTGKDLGLIYTYSPEGKIVEIQPLYAVGTRPAKTEIVIGQEAVIEPAPTTTPITPANEKPTPQMPVSTRTLTRYNPINQTVISVSEGAVSAPNTQEFVTLSNKGQISVWQPEKDKSLTEKLSFALPSGKHPVTLSVKNIKGTETDQIFATVFDPSRKNMVTYVLENKDGTLTLADTMPYFVKEIGCGAEKQLLSQRAFLVGSRPGNARHVVYKKDRFTNGDTAFNTQNNWLTGLNYFPLQTPEKDNLIYTAYNGQLRIVLNNGKRAESKNDFGSTPNRVSYKQEMVRFYPSLQVFGEKVNATLAAVENTTQMGLLSDTFGQYQNGKIHFLSYQQGHFNTQDVVELDGVIYDTACLANDILTAEVLPDETSTLVTISKK